MVKRSLRLAEGFFAVVGVVCTMYLVVACLMPEAAKNDDEDDDFDDFVDPQLGDDPDDDDEDDENPEDDGK